MKSKFFKRLIPMVLGGAAMLMLAMPVTASANDWNHHDNGIHNGWVHRDRDDFHRHWDRDDYRSAPRAYYPNTYYAPQPAVPVYAAPRYAAPYGYSSGCGNMTRLQNVYRYDRRTGHPAAANDVARRMQRCGGGVYGQNSVFGNVFPW